VVAPVVALGVVFIAGDGRIHALDALTGVEAWTVAIEGRVRAPMVVAGTSLLALTEPDRLIAVRLDTREVAWTLPVGGGRMLMAADDRALYVTTPDSRVLCVLLADGTVAWQRTLAGTLSAPAVGRDLVLVGSTTNWLWALEADTGDEEWRWEGKIFGGDVIGADVEGNTVYVASLDNVVRALNRRNGNQLWKQVLKTRPVLPPRAFFGMVAVVGLGPAVSTFLAESGEAVSSWMPPTLADAELQGPPLIDEHLRPFGVAMVAITRDGRIAGVRPTAMTFPEPVAGRLVTLPGRPLPRERLPGDPEPAPVIPPAVPRR
jgi:outer membrane protein assembly factor BamB